MLRPVITKVFRLAITIGMIAIINFLVIHSTPGDAVDVLAGEAGVADAGYTAELRQKFGLDQPLPVQLFHYMSRLLQFDLGYSFRHNMPVIDLIAGRIGPTMLLVGTALFGALLLGVVAGTVAASRQNSLLDYTISVLALVGYATPMFWLGLMLVVLLAVGGGILPASGMTTSGSTATGLAYLIDVLRHLVLPAVTLGLFYFATYARLARASVLDALSQDYIRTARSKGLAGHTVLFRHALRNALLPVATMFSLQFGAALGGAVVVEAVFAWPGLGRLAFEAISQRDYNLLQGILFMSSLLVIAINLLTDFLYTVIDPRIRKRA
ncbi:ABC transporter permease [Ferrovibrio sp.]|uniref:ABC transporter permease n=1 Tax=Ferrovibrio sp. TaxID=1917215 RepID=UPI0025C2C837|nr:ABC transporter permease [Ferrovibrio sp.]MBX3452946.1 ABC transporter permease [Ferrovibrio sp.]